MCSDAVFMNRANKTKTVTIRRRSILPLIVVVMIVGSFAVKGVDSYWNHLVNTPKYAMMCGSPSGPVITHSGIVRYTVNGDIFELYKSGDLWYPSIVIKGFDCMITYIGGANEVKNNPAAGPGNPFPIPKNIKPHQ